MSTVAQETSTARDRSTARAAVFAQLGGAGRVDQVVQRLTDAIVLGVLSPGERLPSEAQLAKRFGVAVVTARDSLGVLRDNGLVETRRGRDGGSFVMPPGAPQRNFVRARLAGLSRVELQDLALYFSVITAGAAARAATRVSPADTENLREWLSEVDYDTESSARRAEGGFHLELVSLSQSARLVREQIRLQAEFGPLLWLALQDPAQRVRSAAYHRAVVDALDDQDADRTRGLVSDHIEAFLSQLLEAKPAMGGRGAN